MAINKMVLNNKEYDLGQLEMIQQLRDQLLDNIIYPNAGAHNSIYRGKYLGDHVTDAQIEAIDAGTFEDLYIGDYWIDTENGIEWLIAEFNYYKDFDKNNISTPNHALLIPRKSLYKSLYNQSTNNDSKGYKSSFIRTGLDKAKALIESFFGDKMVTFRTNISSYLIDNRAGTIEATYSKIELMSEQMVYGSRVMGTPNISSAINVTNYLYESKQLAIFMKDKSTMIDDNGFWLRDVGYSLRFCLITNDGSSNAAKSNNAEFGVRPYFLLGKPQEES
jgi:hypothetical protein